ncbi:hypothetical protein LXL04_036087 [Taraxacum kok-saghyz]
MLHRCLSQNPVEKKMAVNLANFHPDILNIILVLVATSSDGARDLTRLAATCKTLLEQAKELDILKAVNFQSFTFTSEDFKKHRNRKGLLCVCARAGNLGARSMLGKAILVQDPWFLGMIYGDSLLPFHWHIEPNEALYHRDLVRTFILHATPKDVASMCHQLVSYVITYAGSYAAREHGIIFAIHEMCSYNVARLRATRIRQNQLEHGSFSRLLIWLDPPNAEPFNRDEVIFLFDKLFPSVHV